MRQPEFSVSLNIPVFVPTEEEVASVENSLEPFLAKLIESGHLTAEEVVAYMKFSMDLASFAPFFMDEFLKIFRANKNRPAESRIIVPR
jgi:hypothetical protein